MISWIVASHRPDILERHLLPTLQLQDEDELVVVKDAESITLAYAEGQLRATQPVKCYVHSDVRVYNYQLLRAELIHATEERGLVGVIGAMDACVPWWNGQVVGSVFDSRLGTLDFGPGGTCAVLDGVLLATRWYISWDISWPGWHGYDYDASAQVRAVDEYGVWCLTGGMQLIGHYSDSPYALDAIDGWAEAERRYKEKWS
jgi:hypothetical protein